VAASVATSAYLSEVTIPTKSAGNPPKHKMLGRSRPKRT
jgi:hypothetical protein